MTDTNQLIGLLEDMAAEGETNILAVPLIEKLIRGLMPSLLDGSERSAEILNNIDHYLLGQPNLKAPALEKDIPEELFLALYGLKYLLKSHRNNNLNVVSWSIEENKRRFGLFIEGELEEE